MSGIIMLAAGGIRDTITTARISAAMAGIWAAGGVGGQWDFTDPATLFTDDAGTTPVTSHGHSIGLVSDQSPNGLHLTQPTADNKPQWQDAGGLRSALFDGADDFIRSTSTSFDYTGSFTAVIGCMTPDAAGVRALFGKLTNGQEQGYDVILQAGIPRMTLRGTSNIDTGDTGFTSVANQRKAIAFRCSPTGVVREMSGSRVTTLGTWAATVSPHPFALGRRGNSTYAQWQGSIYRALIIGRALTDAEVGWALTWCAAGGANQ